MARKQFTIRRRNPFTIKGPILVHVSRLYKKCCSYSKTQKTWRCPICEKTVNRDEHHVFMSNKAAVDIIHQNRIEGQQHAKL